MANYHLTVKAISRKNGKSCVAALAYRSATVLVDQRTGEIYHYINKDNVGYVEIMVPENSPLWIKDLSKECEVSRQTALQKFSDIIEAAERRKDARVYREIEFSLPNELTPEQNITWAREFVRDACIAKGMVAVLNFHFDVDPKTGQEKPHCHVLLSTRELTETGFGMKNRDWDKKELVEEWREQCAQYQNAALKELGFEVQVSHLSYADQGLDIDPQPKRGSNVSQMKGRGKETDKQELFDIVRLKNQFKIVKNPEIVFSIVTSKHSTFTRKDIAKVLHRYIDDVDQFRVLHDRLMASPELVSLASSGFHKHSQEPVYTTKEMLRIEMGLVKTAEGLAAQQTHKVASSVVDEVINKHNKKLIKYGGLSPDQKVAIRHMLSAEQVSCVIGFAGAGKTTCLEAAREAWEEAGYTVIGLAPTGKAARNIEECGIRAMTIHKFLKAQSLGRERLTDKSVVVLDEAGMVDSRKCSELLSLMDKTGSKIVPMGDGHQVQSVEAGPAFRLLMERVKPAVLETIVRQQTDWQREATRLFGTLQTRSALKLYQEKGCFTLVQEKEPDFENKDALLDNFCLSRQMSGRIWKEMMEDLKEELGSERPFDPETDFEVVSQHQDFSLFKEWKKMRQGMVARIISHYDDLQPHLKERGVDVKTLGVLVADYKAAFLPDPQVFDRIETTLRQMSYDHIVDTRDSTRQTMVDSWAHDVKANPEQSHLMLAFTNTDANKLNEAARHHMREQGKIQGKDYQFTTQRIETDDFGEEHRTYHDRTFAKGDRLLFTRNDNSLKVKNGSLGTIVAIDQNKITVQLDEANSRSLNSPNYETNALKGENWSGADFRSVSTGSGDLKQQLGISKTVRTVSFSPNLYPFIDNGWATTIHKAQGVTVDNVKMLASFEQYRNLSYVGMSRHRYGLQIFASNLDFWREGKVIDRLSRVQDKLSGFDYLDANKIQEVLAEDTDALQRQQKIQQGKDFWTAIKVTARDVFHKAFGRPHVEKKNTEEEFLSFDHSEEMRSKEFFKDHSSPHHSTTQEKEPLTQKDKQPKPSKHSLHDLSSSEGQGSQELQEKARRLELQSINLKRQQYEKERLSANQDYCSHIGFSLQNNRFPEAHEIGWAYWQGERLTAIEGRLYREALKGDKTIDRKDLIQQARKELSKNQAAPDYIMVFGKASHLTDQRLEQFEQHVLMHQDKTGRVPEPVDLAHICKAITSHDQLMGRKGKEMAKIMPNLSKMSENPDIYRILIEQQAILAHIIKDDMKVWEDLYKATSPHPQAMDGKGPTPTPKSTPDGEATTLHPSAHEPEMSKETHNQSRPLRADSLEAEEISKRDRRSPASSYERLSLKMDDIKDACSDRLEKLDSKVQEVKDFAQEMAELDLRRQNDRGIGMDM
jgi:Ti-type conjugative transfer relaxase TraA